MSPYNPRREMGGGGKRGSSVRRLDFGRHLVKLFLPCFSSKRGQMITSVTLVTRDSVFFFGFWSPCRSYAERLPP